MRFTPKKPLGRHVFGVDHVGIPPLSVRACIGFFFLRIGVLTNSIIYSSSTYLFNTGSGKRQYVLSERERTLNRILRKNDRQRLFTVRFRKNLVRLEKHKHLRRTVPTYGPAAVKLIRRRPRQRRS